MDDEVYHLHENSKNINKSDELEKLGCVETSKVYDEQVKDIENISVMCTETHILQHNLENFNKQYHNTNYVTNGACAQDLVQEENNYFINFSNETNGISQKTVPNETEKVNTLEDCKKTSTIENSNSVNVDVSPQFSKNKEESEIYIKCNNDSIHNNKEQNKITLHTNEDNIDNDSDNEFKIQKKAKGVIDSDSEIDDNILHQRKSIMRKKQIIFESDSEEDIEQVSNGLKSINPAPIYNVDDKGKLILETDIRSRSLAICDSESSDEETPDNYEDNSIKVFETKVKSQDKKSKRISNNEDKKITGRDALKLRKEITSESQRMTRECVVNLPYHKPKVRTLKEFLQNRPRFAATVPSSTSNRPPSLAIKMLSEHLNVISEKLSEREKQVEEFFKSESESEEETENINNNFNKNVNIESDISTKSENHCKEDENVGKETTEQNINVNDKTFEQNEKINKLLNEPTVIVLQNIVLNSDTNVETELDKIHQPENFENIDQVQESNTHSVVEVKIFDQDTTEAQIRQSIIQTNGNKALKKLDPDSPQFEFDIDDMSSETEENEKVDNLKTNKLVKEFPSEISNSSANVEDYDKVDKEYNKKSILDKQSKKKSQLDIVKELCNIKPELKGSPGLVIDLEDGSTKLSEVNQLMNRFLKHNKKKTPQKNKVKLDIVSLSSGEIRKETVELSVDDEETIAINEKPGERLKKLRSELEIQMAQRRSQLWQQKSDLKLKNEKCEETNTPHIENETDDNLLDDNLLDDEDEEEFTGSEKEEEEEFDQDEDEDEIKDEPRKKNIFMDEEAEESNPDDDKDSAKDENLMENIEVCHDDDVYNCESNHLSQDNYEVQQKKKLKRIIKPFLNDSDDDDSSLDNFTDSKTENVIVNHEEKNDCILDSTDTWDDSDPTPHQPRNSFTPSKKQTQSKSELGFLTPVVQLTGLQSLNSGSKFLHESPVSPFIIPVDSPIKNLTESKLQKRLFPDTDLATTQELSEVAELCSGEFPSQTQETTVTEKLENSSRYNTTTSNNHFEKDTLLTIQAEPSTQDLLEICSGKFTGFTQSGETETNERSDEENKIITTNIIDNSKPSLQLTKISICNNEIKNLDTEDKLISQLLDEEEMENFKKKFDSPLKKKKFHAFSFF